MATERLTKLQKKLDEYRFDALLVASVPNIIYLTGFSAFSLEEREAYVLILKSNQFLCTDGRYTEAVTQQVPHFTVIETSPQMRLQACIKQLSEKHNVHKIGFEETIITVSEYNSLSKEFGNAIKMIPSHQLIEEIRVQKDKEEITAIQKACELGDQAFTFILDKLKPGVTEQIIALELEYFMKKNGDDVSFPAIAAFGSHSSSPHHQPTDRKLKSTDWILLDFGAKLDNYCSDMTRTLFIGKATPEQKKMYQTVLDAQKKAIEFLALLPSPSSSPLKEEGKGEKAIRTFKAAQVDKVARDHIISQGYPSIPHSLGHGTGIEVHETPRLSPSGHDILQAGNVFSVEPGIYIPNFGGVRIEDLIALTDSVPRVLSHAPKTLIEL